MARGTIPAIPPGRSPSARSSGELNHLAEAAGRRTYTRPAAEWRLIMSTSAAAVALAVAVALPSFADENGATVVFYPVSDLPVWRVDDGELPQFDASILVAHIKERLGSGNWSTQARIIPDEENAGLLVRQTPRNHDKVRMVLAQFREFSARDAAGRLAGAAVDAKLSHQQVLLFVSDPTPTSRVSSSRRGLTAENATTHCKRRSTIISFSASALIKLKSCETIESHCPAEVVQPSRF